MRYYLIILVIVSNDNTISFSLYYYLLDIIKKNGLKLLLELTNLFKEKEI